MAKHFSKVKSESTSWEKVGGWYHGIVGDQGHYHHQEIVLPGVQKLLGIDKSKEGALLDLACGQGVLARHLPANWTYTGIDLSPSLIKAATAEGNNPNHDFFVADVSRSLPIKKNDYTYGAIVLALQNIEAPEKVLINFAKHLQKGSKLVIVLNHPCFRIPRQSSWGIDADKKLQYRRIDRYQSEMKIPIQANPSKGSLSETTWSFHHPLSSYSRWLYETGFHIQLIEEWTSTRSSTGKNAKMENRSREEFPLFMAICAIYLG